MITATVNWAQLSRAGFLFGDVHHAEFDASGAVELGMRGLLVKTGKYRDGDAERVSPAPTAVIDSVASLPDWLDGNA